MQRSKLTRGLFLDRDGVINEEAGYVYRAEEVRFIPGIFALVRTARSLGYVTFVVTNQSGIARGYYSEADFHRLMDWMRLEFAREGANLDAVYHRPFHPDHGVGEYRRDHEDRKPGPGMILRAAREFSIELGESVLVGDRCTDIAAANAAGVGDAFLLAGTEPASCRGTFRAVGSLAEVKRWLIARDQQVDVKL